MTEQPLTRRMLTIYFPLLPSAEEEQISFHAAAGTGRVEHLKLVILNQNSILEFKKLN